jgi:hypothetical protein
VGGDAVQACERSAQGRFRGDVEALAALTMALRGLFDGYPAQRLIDMRCETMDHGTGSLTIGVAGSPRDDGCRDATLRLCAQVARGAGGAMGESRDRMAAQRLWISVPAHIIDAPRDAGIVKASLAVVSAPCGAMRFPKRPASLGDVAADVADRESEREKPVAAAAS